MNDKKKNKMIDKVFRWIKLNAEVEGIDFDEFLSVLEDEIEKRLNRNES